MTARLVRTLLIGAILVIGHVASASAASPAPAQPPSNPAPPNATLTVAPAVITAAVKAGGEATTTLTVRAQQALDITIDPMGLGQSPDDGSFTFVAADQDHSPFSGRSFVSVQPTTFKIEPGEARPVTVTVSLPAGITDGERYALLKINGQPRSGDGNVGIAVALGVSVLITQPGSSETLAGAIRDLSVGTGSPGQPISVTGTIENTGNKHYGAPPATLYQLATLRDQGGTAVATARGASKGNSLVPTFGRQFQLEVAPSQPLPAGHYTVDVEVGLEGGAALDHATAALDVAGGTAGTPGAPPTDLIVLLLAALLGAAGAVVVVVGSRRLRRSPSA